MTEYEEQQLKSLCDNSQSFMDLVDDWKEHKYSDEYLIQRLFKKYHLYDRISHSEIRIDDVTIQGVSFRPLCLHFQLKSDKQWYTLFGIIDWDELMHVSLAIRNPKVNYSIN